MTSRRDLLRALGASVLLPSMACSARSPATPMTMRAATPLGVGIQLYLARKQMLADPEGTLAQIAALGFSEVEWWGRWDRTPQQLRASLDANGLRSPSYHVGTGSLRPDQLPALLDFASAMGQRTLIIASLNARERATEDDWKRVATLMNEASLAAKSQGIRIGYHNHGGESTMFGDRSAFDLLIAGTDPSLVDFQLDGYWALMDGLDPVAVARRHRDRITSLHLKDADATPARAQVDLGTGIIDWPTIIREGAAARVTSLFLDLDDPADVWATAGSARHYLRGLGY